MTVAILLVLLAGAISLAAALAAFIIARGFGKSTFRATCYAAATFVATSTLLLLALTFVESARQDEHAHAYAGSVRVYGPPMIINGNNDSLARTPSFGKAPVRLTRSVLRRTHHHGQRDSIPYEEAGAG